MTDGLTGYQHTIDYFGLGNLERMLGYYDRKPQTIDHVSQSLGKLGITPESPYVSYHDICSAAVYAARSVCEVNAGHPDIAADTAALALKNLGIQADSSYTTHHQARQAAEEAIKLAQSTIQEGEQ